MGSAIAGAGTPNSGLVVLRDELGILSVMRCLDTELTLDRGFQYGYPAESAAMAGLTDPRIAPPLSYVVDAAGQIVAIVCRHITGVRLSRVLAGLPRGLDVQTATSVVKDVLAALGTLHQRGVAHRAPDPEHIIVEPNGACVLIDVGLVARHTKPDPAADIAADLEIVAELFVTCLAPRGRATSRTANSRA
jgi:tRNA A-37 threonylcarbamoyl transferase component Bud32